MLAEITIRNFAIIDRLTVEFGAGMTVLSGETGAGKSILVDALNLVLGERADAEAIRDGAERAEISARFAVDDAPAAAAWLAERELDDAGGDHECVIRRTIAAGARSKAWINGSPMPVRELRSLGRTLVDIHGQHAQQSLLGRAAQRRMLDAHGGHTQALDAVAAAAAELEATLEAIARIEQIDAAGDARIDLLGYQVNELQALGLGDDELESLEAEHRRLASAERLIADGQRTLAALFDAEDGAAMDRLGQAERTLAELATIDDGFAAASELTASARIQTQEAVDELRRHVETLEVDPKRFQEVEQRLAGIQDLARKHRCAPSELPALTARLAAELAELENAGQRLAALKTERARRIEAYETAAATLSRARREDAATLAGQITAIIHTLGMPQGVFDVRVTPTDDGRFARSGRDAVEFLIAANPGETARPLDRVASGGELSRISLAIEVVAAATTRVPTLVFDEVDTGIGGGVAEIVGRQLHALGESGQSLCVTHLPQVAALASHHLRVSKQVHDGRTTTAITALDDDGRVEELARMLGGVEITAQTRAHAADMVERAQR